MKVVEARKLWNFVVHNFFIWSRIVIEKLGSTSKIWNYNFEQLLIWVHLKPQKINLHLI
jgi:hypothetical protein